MPQNLVYHTFYGEFRGASADDVVQSFYLNCAAGTGESFPEWWARQQNSWDRGFIKTIPSANSDGACAKLIDALVRVGALLPGPKPARSSAPEVSLG